ncbi:MAG: murein L,D-transpeptidase catalytic domain family protein [Porticoccaceae bacterium]|nr:murein L,D-transpeptidase catalytic domain family protein [Porticoccaceae bacterium]
MSAPVFSIAASLDDNRLFQKLSRSAPDLKTKVLKNALQAARCAVTQGVDAPAKLAVIDYSLPSTEKRLWIFDIHRGRLLLQDLVAHGRRSGELTATTFSNREGSHQSSIGLFRGHESYSGKHGYSLRLDGLEPGINDNARNRAIVIHGADYVDPTWIDRQGRIGRSLGCPAVRREIAKQVVDNLKDGQLVFSYYPDQDWLNSSSFLNCDKGKIVSQQSVSDGNS